MFLVTDFITSGISFLTPKTATIVCLFRLLATCEKIFIRSAPKPSAIHANTAQDCSLLHHFWQTSPYVCFALQALFFQVP